MKIHATISKKARFDVLLTYDVVRCICNSALVFQAFPSFLRQASIQSSAFGKNLLRPVRPVVVEGIVEWRRPAPTLGYVGRPVYWCFEFRAGESRVSNIGAACSSNI